MYHCPYKERERENYERGGGGGGVERERESEYQSTVQCRTDVGVAAYIYLGVLIHEGQFTKTPLVVVVEHLK